MVGILDLERGGRFEDREKSCGLLFFLANECLLALCLPIMENEETATTKKEKKRSAVGSLLVGIMGIFSAVYLFNPGAGFIELIPDNIPVIGNLDEAAATALLISCLTYFGLDLGSLFGRHPKKKEDYVDVEIIDEDVKDR